MKYRFKTEAEFKKEGLWDNSEGIIERPDGWDEEMLHYLSKDLTNEYSGEGDYIEDDWFFQQEDILQYIEGAIEKGDTVRCVESGKGGQGWKLGLEFIVTSLTSRNCAFGGDDGNGVYLESLELVKKATKIEEVSEYACDPMPEGATKLRVIKRPPWVNNPNKFESIPKSLTVGSITWCDRNTSCYLIEDNKYRVNFDKSCFEVIEDEIIMTKGYKPIENYTQIIELLEDDDPFHDFKKGDIVYADDTHFLDKAGHERNITCNEHKVLKVIDKGNNPNPVKEDIKTIKEENHVKTSNEVQHTIREDSGYEREGAVILQSRESRINITEQHLSNEGVVIRCKRSVIMGKK